MHEGLVRKFDERKPDAEGDNPLVGSHGSLVLFNK